MTVQAYRDLISYAIRKAGVDYSSCVNAREVDIWRTHASRLVWEMRDAVCPTAKDDDRRRFADALHNLSVCVDCSQPISESQRRAELGLC